MINQSITHTHTHTHTHTTCRLQAHPGGRFCAASARACYAQSVRLADVVDVVDVAAAVALRVVGVGVAGEEMSSM